MWTPLRTKPKGRGTQATGSWALPHFSHVTNFSSSKTYLLGPAFALTVTLILIDMLYPSPSVLCVSHHRKPILCLNMRVPRIPSQVCPCALCDGRSTGEWPKAGERKQLNCMPYLALNRALWNAPWLYLKTELPSFLRWRCGKEFFLTLPI